MRSIIAAHEQRSLLRFLLCGSVDDGKSTLIGRLLFESHALYADQLAALELDSRKSGTQGDSLDFALLTDGLAAEREQGITIDVAYRHFSTERRHFIVADCPGHVHYTRNMITGASTADCAVILVDGRQGVVTQTRRHSYLVSLLGIHHVVLAVNKMDLVDFDETRFREVESDYRRFASQIGLVAVTCIPVSALSGENVLKPGAHLDWFQGPTLMGFLETVDVEDLGADAPFRLPVQWVNRSSADFRGFAGSVVGGVARAGDRVVVAGTNRESAISRIVTADGDQPVARPGQAVTLILEDEIDVSRGEVLAPAASPPDMSNVLEATIVWMHDEPLLRGRTYIMQIGMTSVTATIAPIKYKVNVDSLEHVAANTLELNEIGVCDLELGAPVPFDSYEANRATGGFILIDRITYDTVGAGLIRFSLRRSQNLRWQEMSVDRDARATTLQQNPCVLWLTGLSGAGKSTIADEVESELHRRGHHTYVLDGDNVRHGLNRDLGFTDADRVENIRRVGEVARLMVDAGLIVLVSFISPFRAERRMARSLLGEGQFLEVFVDTPLSVAEDRDPKGLYRKARRGEIKNFTGIDSPYEPPERPEVRVDTTAVSASQAASEIVAYLEASGLIPRT